MVGILMSFWDGLFSGAFAVSSGSAMTPAFMVFYRSKKCSLNQLFAPSVWETPNFIHWLKGIPLYRFKTCTQPSRLSWRNLWGQIFSIGKIRPSCVQTFVAGSEMAEWGHVYLEWNNSRPDRVVNISWKFQCFDALFNWAMKKTLVL